jgi:hypothetical protein
MTTSQTRVTPARLNLSVSLSVREIETLDQLVVATAAYRRALPLLAAHAELATRSSALRDLLLAWKYSLNAAETFPLLVERPGRGCEGQKHIGQTTTA